VLSKTHLQPDRWWYLHELARALGLQASSVQGEIVILASSGILARRRDGNRVYFKADPTCPIFPEIRALLIKTVGLVDILRDALKTLGSKIQLAFVYGSIASAEERSASDVDLMIIGSARLADVAAVVRQIEPQLSRSVNPTVYSPEEFAKKLKAGHNFLKNVTTGEKLFIVGSEHDLAELIGERAR
jgi:predicted nucleotidyltransferase